MFQSFQVLYAIDPSQVTNSALNQQTLQTVIANTMTGVVAANIVNLVAVETPFRRRRLGAAAGARAAAAAAAVPSAASGMAAAAGIAPMSATVDTKLIYTVTLESTINAAQLYSELTTAVFSGAFTTDLNNYAQSVGATELVGTSSNYVGYEFTLDTGEGKSLSAGAIAGIVIGTVAFVIILCVAVFYLCFR